MKQIVIKKTKLHESQSRNDLQERSPDKLVGMMWQLALDAWSFKESLNAEPRLQRHVVVIRKGEARSHHALEEHAG
jgi:hypothetical protein